MADDCLSHRQSALRDAFHQRKAAARRLHFKAGLKVRRAGVQAESTVDALVQVFVTRRVWAEETGECPRRRDWMLMWVCHLCLPACQIRLRYGLRTCRGSGHVAGRSAV